jgi:hypothetical protein
MERGQTLRIHGDLSTLLEISTIVHLALAERSWVDDAGDYGAVFEGFGVGVRFDVRGLDGYGAVKLG